MAAYESRAAATRTALRVTMPEAPSPVASPTSRVERLRYLTFGRAVPAALFGTLAYLQGVRLFATWGSLSGVVDVAAFVSGALYLLFIAIPVGIYLTRPMPRARDGRALPRIAAFGGTTIQLLVGVLVSNVMHISAGPVLFRSVAVGLPLELAAFGLAVYGLLYLRRNLSLIPEARGLVTGGPYALVRHPLYVAEIAAAVGRTLDEAAVLTIGILVVFIGLQLLRARYEERLLASVFPEYRAYAAGTARLLPGLW
ncbi:MAG: isoprenylcysteine carboxylmethyltransferase family protein [Candidatus Dormibacteria bacterium]